MADFRLSKRQQEPSGQKGFRLSKRGAPKAPSAASPEQSSGLLAQAGGSAMSGLHTIGSILSTPSRVLWGGINGLSGGAGGFGGMNPLDSTNGIELSHVLGNLGVMPKNDASKWELMDFGRGVVDAIGDPTSWLGVGGLTKAGVAASRLAKSAPGALAKGVVTQVRSGQRGLLSVHHPLATVSHGAFGTGANVADALQAAGNKTGAFTLAKAVNQSSPVRHVKALMDARYAGKIHNSIQKFSVPTDEARRAGQRAIDLDHLAIAQKLHRAGVGDSKALRDVVEGINPAMHAHGAEMKAINDAMHAQDAAIGFKTGDLLDDVEHFPRRMSEGIEGAGPSGFEMSQNKLHARDDVWKGLGGTNEINRMLTDTDVAHAIEAVAHLPVADQVAAGTATLMRKNPHILNYDQLGEIAKKVVGVPELRTQGLFGNHPLHDLHSAASAANNRKHGADLIFKAIADAAHDGPHGVNVNQFLDSTGFHPHVAEGHIRAITGHAPGDILNKYIPKDLAEELATLTPGFRSPPAASVIADAIKSVGTIWKASALAHPASRVRDAFSGVVQNLLMGHSGVGGWNEARNIAHGTKLTHDYSHLPEVADLMSRHGLSHDDAVKTLLAVEAPRNAGAIADISPGQVGSTLDDMLAQIPGNTPSGFREVMGRAAKSLVKGELGRNGTPISQGRVYSPANIAGAFGRETTAYGPAAASNVVSGATDEFNRHAGILGQMRQGTDASVAGSATRAAQVDYDQSKYTPFEQNFLKQLMPFYGFTSRMAGHTASQLANPGGRLGQLLKAEDRAHSNDPAIPDSVLSGTALPLGEHADGTKRFITGAGFQHEPAIHTLGALLGGNFQGVGYDVMGMLNPLLKTPIEQTTGRSFYQRGEDLQNMDPNIGRTLANLGVIAGRRDKDAGPVTFPGSKYAEALVQASPLSRLTSTAKSLTDTRKGIGEKILNQGSGFKVTDVSPKKQAATIIRRAEELAKSKGAKSRSDVYFSKSELEQLAKTDPALYQRQVELQHLLSSLKAKQRSSSAKK